MIETIEKTVDLAWRGLAALKSQWCVFTGRHNSQPLFGELLNLPDHPDVAVPAGFATFCDSCMVVTLYTGRHLYGRRKS
jgi:hypothetical protein